MGSRLHTAPSRSLAIWLALLGSPGCSSYEFKPDAVLVVDEAAETWVPTDDTSPADVLLISDTHASNPMAPHALLSDGDLADTYVTRVAVRPPQMDQWGSRIVDWVLEQPRHAQTIIHLGDVANIGCLGEFARFSASLQRRRAAGDLRRWYIAPGNHDSLVLGNWGYSASPTDMDTKWSTECAGTAISGVMDKHGFLAAYLAAQVWTEVVTPRDPGDDYTCSDVVTHDDQAMARICRRPTAYQYDSFMIQAIAINPDVTILLLDTTQFRQHPRLTYPGGKTGGIGTRQLDEARRWLAKLGGKRVILAGHHPISFLDDASQEELALLIHDVPIVAYLSAHTHDAANVRLHPTAAADDQHFLEINVGSLIDWPMEYGYLRVRPVPQTADSTELTLTVAALSKQLEAECRVRWGETRVRTGEPDYYVRDHHEAAAYDGLRASMFQRLDEDLAAYPPALPHDYARTELVDGGPPSELLGDLAQAAQVASYERCQALWASEAESLSTLSPWNTAVYQILGLFSPTPTSGPDPVLRADSEEVATRRWQIGPR
jgi:Calcineurin-like phosphoesterase